MTKLTQKNVKFDWGEKEETAFQLIKQKLCSTSILALPKGDIRKLYYVLATLRIRIVYWLLMQIRGRCPSLSHGLLALNLPKTNPRSQTECALKPETSSTKDVEDARQTLRRNFIENRNARRFLVFNKIGVGYRVMAT
ncbi:hypothetical protein Tco_1042965 [Tanacetum coccineum]|uniref:Reverse transcriptase domain-containing protein n=1 Tax=Tanacetum coccineum TaxID=301880 RepID=A0ABQ5GL84_9ASTR